MEMNGMGFNPEQCSAQKETMQAKLAEIEQQAYTLAGHPFSLSSSSDISQVLFLELRLPPSGDPSNPGFTRSLGTTRRSTRAKQQYSTAKEVLEKLQPLHPLPALILEWRKVSNTLTKVVFPLMKEKLFCACLDMYRLHGDCQTFTSTGRVSMQEPNFQNIPKAFDIGFYSAVEKKHKGVDLNRTLPVCINMRQVFVPFKGGVILAADYSQLELRVIAHLSKDKQLIDILNSNMDVFKMIAAKWKGITVDDVSASQRQQAKQICYGMIYGIGAKALGEQLNVDINEANMFIESFKNRFKGMRVFLRDTVNQCREKGYVETMLKRRRYLPAIRDSNIHAKAHAERQSVNTTVQGSAADIVKKAMIQIDKELTARFPNSIIPHLAREKGTKVRGAFFILQLHDELIYEVFEHDLERVKGIVKYHMENATKLSVHLPVKLSVGKSWGELVEVT
jgi:DNA polymerase theta